MSGNADVPPLPQRLLETVRHFGDLGFTSFGGPGVHVVLLKRRFVDRLEWIEPATFADLFALANALPGPGSTQLCFSIAVARGGLLCGVLAFFLWSIPAALVLFGLGTAIHSLPPALPAIVLAFFSGINAAAVGLIALAAVELATTAITDIPTRLLVLGSASFGICYQSPWIYPVLVVAGGLVTLSFDYRKQTLRWLRRKPDPPAPPIELQTPDPPLATPIVNDETDTSLRRRSSRPSRQEDVEPAAPATSRPLLMPSKAVSQATALLLVLMVIILPTVRSQLAQPPRELDFLTNMLLSGIMIFGGGPVVIPLLRQFAVEPGWVQSQDFLLGYAFLQALPGPNFNFSVFLGVLAVPHRPFVGALLGWLGIFLPGMLAKTALLPVYSILHRRRVVRSILRGLNASASGLVFIAVWQLFLVGYIYQSPSGSHASASAPLVSDPWWGVVAAWSFSATRWLRSPPALSILLGGLAGLAWFGVRGGHPIAKYT